MFLPGNIDLKLWNLLSDQSVNQMQRGFLLFQITVNEADANC